MHDLTAKQLTLGGVVLALLVALPLLVPSPFFQHVMIITFISRCAGWPGT